MRLGVHTASIILLLVLAMPFPFGQGGAPSTAGGPLPTEAHIIFMGDIMLGRYVNVFAKGNFDPAFSGISSYVSSADLAVANMEGPLVPLGKYSLPVPAPNNLNLTANALGATAIARAGFDILSVANNHSLDAGQSGLSDTIGTLQRAGLTPIGAQQGPHENVVIREVRGIRIGFLAYTDIENNHGPGIGYVPPGDAQSRARMVEDITSARQQVDVLVLFMHWGTEYALQPNGSQRELAQMAASAGADLVVGAHPHVAQGMELKGSLNRPTLVEYSLGNALFDQEFSPDVRAGLALDCRVDRNGVKSARLVPLQITRGNSGYATVLNDNANGQAVLQRSSNSTPPELQWKAIWDVAQQPGLAIGYYRNEQTSNRQSMEDLGLPQPARVELHDGTLSVSAYPAGAPGNGNNDNGQTVWQSGDGWRVTGYTVGDVNTDGRPELVYTLWKHRLVWEFPDTGGLRVNMDGGEYLPHIYISGWRNGQIVPVWYGSPRPAPSLAVAVAPVGKDGKPLLAVLQSANREWEEAPGTINLWEWTNGFGFELAAPVPGAYWQMWSDGRVLLFR